MNSILKDIVALFIFTIFCSCSDSHKIEKLKQEIISTDKSASEYAMQKGFNASLLQYADNKFVKLNDGSFPIISKPEFAKTIKDKKDIKSITWQPVEVEVAESGELGYTWGNWKFISKDTVMYGNYFTVWKKQLDGSWKMALDGGNTTPSPNP